MLVNADGLKRESKSIMKKLLVFMTLIIALLLCLTACHSHKYGEWTTTKAPSCEQDGEQERSCSCGEIETRTIMPTGHDWNDATCIAPKTCVDCKATEGSANGHNFGDWEITTIPTCVDKGEMAQVCNACGFEEKSFVNPIPTNHKPATDASVSSTCTESGLTEGSHCSLCSVVIKAQEPIPAKGHEKEIVPGYDSTCTKMGLTDGEECAVCGVTLLEQKEIPLKSHAYDDEYDGTCNNCPFERDPKCRHSNTELIKGYPATCTTDGYDDGIKCSDCEEILLERKSIPATGHTEEIIPAVSSTCYSTGLAEGVRCKVCHDILKAQELVEKLDHIPANAVRENVVNASCTKEGSYDEVVYCSVENCKAQISKSTKIINATGHTFSEWITIKEATPTEEGLKERICSCGKKETEIIPVKISEGLEYTLNDDGVSYSVKGIGTCTDTEIVIPREYNNLPVTIIGESAFCDNYKIISVTIPDSVISIGEYAFAYCQDIENFTLPDSLTSIGAHAFDTCISITSITIPESVTNIGEYAFHFCISLTSVGSVGSGASVEIPSSVTSMDGLFSYCTGLTSVSIPNSVTNIDGAFSGCDSLTKVIIPNSVTSIGEYAFSSCKSLTSIGPIGSGASVEIPDTVISIGDHAFDGCESLASLIIPDSVTSIGYAVFQGCTFLEKVTISNSLTSINDWTFASCKSLKSIGPVGSGASVEIPSSVTIIREEAFYNCTALKTITIPDTVANIMGYVFRDCKALECAIIEGSVSRLNNEMFYNCVSLKSITIPSTISYMMYHVFENCTLLTSISFKGTIEQWNAIYKESSWNENSGEYTIYCTDGEITKDGTVTYYSKGLEFTLNDDGESYSVTGIGTCADTEIIIPSIYNKLPVTYIEAGAFYKCTSLKSIVIPAFVTIIDREAFRDCSSLDSVTFAKSSQLTTLNWRAFYKCTSLTNISIPEGVISIESSAFEDCSSLASIVIPFSVKTIGNSAFYRCTSLMSLVYTGTVEQFQTISIWDWWNGYVPATYVQCSDGKISLN